MNKLILPIVGIIINILLYSLLPYDGEFGLLIIIGLVVSAITGFILGLIVDNTKRKRIKYLIFALSITALAGISWWIFPLKQ